MSALGTFGVGHGFFFTSYNLVMVEVLGLPLLQPMLSVTGLFKSSSFLIFGPLIGLVRDLSGSFPVCLTLLGVIDFFSIALWILIPFARSPPARKPLPRVRKPNLHSTLGQDSNPYAWRPLGPQSTHGSTVPRRSL
ncbi:hypothetical protein E2C01_022279 [Portunus trituberculatus]|uniref:Uncharacterized protein n=1 Tax=Portunus trituberculatus TaxID=210409 RepID=A0A5B7E4Y0_PORTR|nr:hypothetical protein [Portunus trituberculatus]